MPAKRSQFLWFRSELMRWHTNVNARTMPWKGEKDAYKIWLSEVILQQTRVEQGLSYYHAFVKSFPTIKHLAEADEKKVFKLWEGLGYYSRCRNLIATAKMIAENYNGVFPNDYERIISLKGVGPYTAAAIASFAFNLPHAVVDGNVYRVLSRFFGKSIPIDSTEGKKEFAALAQMLLDENEPALYNQAIMDLGATVCTPKQAKCSNCALAEKCVALQTSSIYDLPTKSKKIVIGERWFYYFLLKVKGNIWVRERVEKDIWTNLHEFVLEETSKSLSNKQITQLAKGFGVLELEELKISASYSQKLTHLKMNATFVEASLPVGTSVKGYELLSAKRLGKLAFPKIINMFLKDKNYL